jgi:multidrug efflux system membrane fusion protein
MTLEPVPRDAAEAEPSPVQSRAAPMLKGHRRLVIVGATLLAGAALYLGLDSLIAYTDDAYIRSDLVAIAPEVAGFVLTVAVQDNQLIHTGDLIATLDPQPYQLDVDLKQRQIDSLQAAVTVKAQSQDADTANLDAAKASLVFAERQFARMKTLAGEQYVSQVELDRASDTLKNAQDEVTARQAASQVKEREVAAAKAQVAVAQAELAVAQYSLSKTRLVAPVNGYINNLSLRPGAYIHAGEAAIGIVDASRWRVVANFKEEIAAPLTPGMRVWVWLDSRPWQLWAGRVQGVGRGIARDQTPDALLPYVAPTTDWIRLRRRLPVTVLLDPPVPADALFSGADARVFLFR